MSLTSATTGQETTPGVDGGLATISGSTNECTYNVVIKNDGSAKATVSGILFKAVELRELPPGTIDTTTLLSLLTQIGDVARIPTATTEIAYAGRKSGNLRSIPQQASGDQALLQGSKDLGRFVQATLSQLNIG
jgi:hypothetical protein